jgi:hypothetical protein
VHGSQSVASVVAANSPAGQSVHAEASEPEYVPAAHEEHELEASLEYFPPLQEAQSGEPSEELKRPPAHARHVDAPAPL